MATKKKKPLSNDEMVKRMANVLKDKEQVPIMNRINNMPNSPIIL